MRPDPGGGSEVQIARWFARAPCRLRCDPQRPGGGSEGLRGDRVRQAPPAACERDEVQGGLHDQDGLRVQGVRGRGRAPRAGEAGNAGREGAHHEADGPGGPPGPEEGAARYHRRARAQGAAAARLEAQPAQGGRARGGGEGAVKGRRGGTTG